MRTRLLLPQTVKQRLRSLDRRRGPTVAGGELDGRFQLLGILAHNRFLQLGIDPSRVSFCLTRRANLKTWKKGRKEGGKEGQNDGRRKERKKR